MAPMTLGAIASDVNDLVGKRRPDVPPNRRDMNFGFHDRDNAISSTFERADDRIDTANAVTSTDTHHSTVVLDLRGITQRPHDRGDIDAGGHEASRP